MSTLTNVELQAIRERCEAATPGPWEDMCDEKFHVLAIGSGERIATMRVKFDAHQNCANSIFISEARTDIPALLAHIEEQKDALASAKEHQKRLVAIIEELVESAEDLEGCTIPDLHDKARAALASVEDTV